ncbi:MAG: nitrogen regulation protein NR(II), partial [Acidimicrobiales bacterium]
PVERKLPEPERLALTKELAERSRELALSTNTIFDESLTGMVQLAADARILIANRAMASLVGSTRDELVGKSVLDLFGPTDGVALVSAVTDVLAAGEPHRSDALLVGADGSTRLTALQLSRLTMDATGSPVVLLTANDITAGSSAMLRHAHDQKLEELGRLAAGLAHEIRSPLQYLTTSIDFARSAVKELLDHQAPERDPELRRELDESLTEVAEGAARISQIVKGMNILSHRTSNDIGDHDVRDALKFPLAVARGQAPAGTEFVVDLGDVPLVACGLGLMQQVVLNLLVNAIDAIDDRLRDVPRHTGKIVVATSFDQSWVKIAVRDNGVGMDADVMAQAMEPFFTTKAEGRGTGQGLSLVRDIMSQHGGTVNLESTVDQGTTATVHLPRTDSDL